MAEYNRGISLYTRKENKGDIKMNIEITDIAKEKLGETLEDKGTDKLLKIYVAGHGWGGPSFGMALEESNEEDLKVESEGFEFLIGDGLEDIYEKFTVDYSDSPLRKGFVITPSK